MSRIGGQALLATPTVQALGVSASALESALATAAAQPDWWATSGLPLQLQAAAGCRELELQESAGESVLLQQADAVRTAHERVWRAHAAASAAGGAGVLMALQAAKRIHRNVGLAVGAFVGWQAGSFLHQQENRALLAARRVTQEETGKFAEGSILAGVARQQQASAEQSS